MVEWAKDNFTVNGEEETKTFYRYDGDTLFIDRGLTSFVESEVGQPIRYERPYLDGTPAYHNIILREHQKPAVDAILANKEGILCLPAGSGKTTCAIAAMCKVGRPHKFLVLVDKIELATQWIERLEQFAPSLTKSIFGGGNPLENTDVVIGVIQTIRSRYDDLLDNGFFDRYTMVIHDECHNSSAETYNLIVKSFSSHWRVGLSATPFKSNDPNDVISALGPVIYEITSEQLYKDNILKQAEIMVIRTNFDFPFHGDLFIEKGKPCPLPNCKRQGHKHYHRNNYHKLIPALVDDEDRINLVIKNILDNKDRINLVLSKRIQHFNNIENGLVSNGYPNGRIEYLTGKESKKERERVIERINKDSGIVVFSTIADEGLDVPRLDVVHLTYPTKNNGLIKQQIGRVERYRSDKGTPLVYDYCDIKLPVLAKHFKERKLGVYKPGNYKINII